MSRRQLDVTPNTQQIKENGAGAFDCIRATAGGRFPKDEGVPPEPAGIQL